MIKELITERIATFHFVTEKRRAFKNVIKFIDILMGNSTV